MLSPFIPMNEFSAKRFFSSRWAKTGLWLLVWLGMIGLGFGFVSYLFGLPAPRLVESIIGARGPVVLEFLNAVDEESFTARVKILPPVAGRWQVEDNRAIFWPTAALDPVKTYRLQLDPGVTDPAGRKRTRTTSQWSLQIRQPQIVFIGGTSTQPEVWKANADGSDPVALTETGGTVYDFAVSPDGGQIAYSASNAEGGYDLWIVDRAGQNIKQAVDCGADWCLQPAWSPDGRLSYIQKPAGLSASWESTRIWLLDASSGQREPLISAEDLPGFLPSWSPDGRRIATYDSAALGVRVLDLLTGENLLLPTLHESAGSWSPDGSRFFFLDTDHTAFRPLTVIFEVDFATGAIRPLLTLADERYEYGLPQIAPDGGRLVLSARPVEGQPGIQLWTLNPDGSDVQPITNDVTYTHARYRWNPAGGAVLYQRLLLGTSNSAPEVWLWSQTTGESILLAEDASQPDWLP